MDVQEVRKLDAYLKRLFGNRKIRVGADGALYFTDWQNTIIGHMQHICGSSRDHIHGRIYRVTYDGRELSRVQKIAGAPVAQLLDLLKSPEDRVRYRARIELSGRPTAEVTAAAASWAEGLDPKDPDYQHHLLEALWIHQHHNVVNEPLLKRLLTSPDYHARAAATRVLCYWHDRVSDPLALLEAGVNDENPRVRLESLRAELLRRSASGQGSGSGHAVAGSSAGRLLEVRSAGNDGHLGPPGQSPKVNFRFKSPS